MARTGNKIIELSRQNINTHTYFRDEINIPGDILKRITDKGKKYGFETVKPFQVENFELAQWVGLKCRYGCSQFNTNWSCPPATPELTQARAIISEYSIALLLVGSHQCTNFHINSNKKRSGQVRFWKGTVSLERQLFLDGYDKAFSLVSGACTLCKKCTYPEACRFPTEKRPTIESLSIDVIGTLKNLGQTSTIATQTGDTYNYYGIILLE